MKLQVQGVKRVIGTAKATGQPFDMCTLFAMVPIETVSSAKITVQGAGFELAEINLDADSLPQFLGLSYPLVLDLVTDSRPYRGKFETVVTGFHPIVAKVVPAARVG